jgi:hypothetical protein
VHHQAIDSARLEAQELAHSSDPPGLVTHVLDLIIGGRSPRRPIHRCVCAFRFPPAVYSFVLKPLNLLWSRFAEFIRPIALSRARGFIGFLRLFLTHFDPFGT